MFLFLLGIVIGMIVGVLGTVVIIISGLVNIGNDDEEDCIREIPVTYEEIKEIIDKHDPMGLFKMGAPSDEYDSEIEDIVRRINENNISMKPEEVKVLFEYWFYPGSMDIELATKISDDIQNLLERKEND